MFYISKLTLIFLTILVNLSAQAISLNKCYEITPQRGAKSIDCLVKNSQENISQHYFYYNEKNEITPYICISGLELKTVDNQFIVSSQGKKVAVYESHSLLPLESGLVSYTDEFTDKYTELPLNISDQLIDTAIKNAEEPNICLPLIE